MGGLGLRAIDEFVVLLDQTGRPIGTAPKATVHQYSTPYHLAFSCYVFNPEGQLLVTRRALTKLTWPGVWTNSCCGHPGPGEPIEDAVRRRLAAELAIIPTELKLALPNFAYRARMYGIEENEFCPVYLAMTESEPELNRQEVEDFVWSDYETFAARSDISPWAIGQVDELRPFVAQFLTHVAV